MINQSTIQISGIWWGQIANTRGLPNIVAIFLFASQSQHWIRTGCASGRQCRSRQRQQQHCDGRKCKHTWIERAYLKQQGTQQTGCGHGSKQTQATANRRKPGAGTQDDQDHSGALAAKPLG